MASFLITGGGGFIGSNLTEAVLKRGDDVRVLDDFSSGRRENLTEAEQWAGSGGAKYELMVADICDPEVCREAMAQVDYVLHQAAIPSVQRSVKNPIKTNPI